MALPVRIVPLALLAISACSFAAPIGTPSRVPAPTGMSASVPFDAHLLVDQFGYRPQDPKVAVIRNPHVGYDATDNFSAGAIYQVRRAEDGNVVFTGAPRAWNHGAVDATSGDSGWWFDFSAVDQSGRYFLYDAKNGVRSAIFNIDQQVYKDVLKAALRMYFYQRSGFAKRQPYADSCWADEAAYIGTNQDREAHDISDPNNKAKIKDLSGGWFDAGDTNKYVTFAAQAVHQLLTAYEEAPAAFTDDFNIPESGNGIPDVLDEVKWETDWLKRMQYPDGSAALKVGEIVYAAAAPPSSDHNARYYIPSCSSATIAVAGMLAHASHVFSRFTALSTDATELKGRAVAAWNNYQGVSTKQTHCDTGVVHAGNADWSEADQNAAAVVAAIYLYAITDDTSYQEYIKAHFRELRPYHDIGWSRDEPEQGEALLFYTTLAHADAALRTTILSDKLHDVRAGNQVYGFVENDDLYRDFLHPQQYHWGSNSPRAAYANTNVDVLTYNLNAGDAASYRTRALEALHYFHGVNPFAMVYVSNMYSYGATRSANEIYHTWFWHETKWSDAQSSECGPAPGYVPGGPNARASHDGVPSSLVPPNGQPPQKSYRDWNVGAPESSWVITEPAIYYQSGYVKLLSKFAR